MRRAAAAIGGLVRSTASAVGLEGSFLALGTVITSVGASFVSPAGPWFVVGIVCLIAGIALALPAGKD